MRLPRLRGLSLLMPDRAIVDLLPEVCRKQVELDSDAAARTGRSASGLETLTILSRDSPVLSNTHLALLAPHLTALTALTLTGCPKVNDQPLLDFLRHTPSLLHLALEGVGISPTFFATLAATGVVPLLRSLKTTHPGPSHRASSQFYPSLETFITSSAASDLTSLTHYCSGAGSGGTQRVAWPVVPLMFVKELVRCRGEALRRFEVNGILVGLRELGELCVGARGIQYLVCHLAEKDVVSSILPLSVLCDPLSADGRLQPRLSAILSQLHSLRTLHILSRLHAYDDQEVLEIASHCAPTLRHIGVRNRRVPQRRLQAARGLTITPWQGVDRLSGVGARRDERSCAVVAATAHDVRCRRRRRE